MKDAELAAITMSQARAIFAPAPAATPFTAQITGFSIALIFVMIGAISIAFFGFKLVKNKSQTVFDEPIHLPGTTHISKELVIGSLLFGAGWALAGFCPGPALVALGAGYKEAFIFVTAMIVGMYVHDHLFKACKKTNLL